MFLLPFLFVGNYYVSLKNNEKHPFRSNSTTFLL